MSTPIKTPTPWRPVSGLGSVALIGQLPITVSLLPLVDNALKLPITNGPTVTKPKNATAWTQVG